MRRLPTSLCYFNRYNFIKEHVYNVIKSTACILQCNIFFLSLIHKYNEINFASLFCCHIEWRNYHLIIMTLLLAFKKNRLTA